MAYSDTCITFHLVKDKNAVSLDDTICIVKNLEDRVFEITYKDNGDPVTHKAYEMSRDNICDYVYLLLKTLTLDEDGYQLIQFSLPAMPRILISVSKLQDTYYREHFLELVENSLSMIDKVERLSIKKPVEKKAYNSACGSCDYHTNHGCCEFKMNTKHSVPHLPESPVHRYFE